MHFEISEMLATKLLAKMHTPSDLRDWLTENCLFHGTMLVSSKLFDDQALHTFRDLCEAEDDRPLMFQVSAISSILNDPEREKVGGIEHLVPALISYFSRDIIDGWLYKKNKDGVLLPWLVNSVRHFAPSEGSPYVIIGLIANTILSSNRESSDDYRKRRSGMTNAIVLDANDIANRSIPEILAERGYFKESPELKREYESHAERFLKIQPRFGKQYVCKKAAFLVCDKYHTDFVRMRDGVTAKCVNDEETLERQFEMTADCDFWRDHGVHAGGEKIPLHCYVYLFHLELHRHMWVHVQNLTEYQYKPELRDRLILPQDHRDLIDTLTSSMCVLEDIVEGKSGGATILCKGAPGLGKTLTAEVYSEVVGKPLYRVHSGQLGITAASVEANLAQILQRAARWDSILLLDEADVYIRCRDNDLQHNAIVAEFLRTLEYFSGLLFMTTNRTDDVDDAILSRCIAIIQYEVPPKESAARLWQSLALQFRVELSESLVDTLTETYPSLSGRDIKELLKLTAKFCESKKMPLSREAFRQCAVFRGVR